MENSPNIPELDALIHAIQADDTECVAELVAAMDDEVWDGFLERCGCVMDFALSHRAWSVLAWLLDNGYEWHHHYDSGASWALYAALDVATALIEHEEYGVDFGQEFTPLMLAASDDNLRVVSFLLQLGADPNIEGDRGRTALDMTEDPECRELLAVAMAAHSKE